ncbi:hypothetical protein OsI_33978 [Oryza sativa Indica Group]|uniref:Uncharacterized protein n=1 Tax=Oryza sativa subsp. indica TaxID=39946 RepID=A2Z8E1_ORYSI|nr:hypothetical protein OsI_33978 [Oryza sativa Indica Group]
MENRTQMGSVMMRGNELWPWTTQLRSTLPPPMWRRSGCPAFSIVPFDHGHVSKLLSFFIEDVHKVSREETRCRAGKRSLTMSGSLKVVCKSAIVGHCTLACSCDSHFLHGFPPERFDSLNKRDIKTVDNWRYATVLLL